MRAFVFGLVVACTLGVQGQGKKLPNFSFAHNSVAFANANRTYDAEDRYADTIHDERILAALLQIMLKNPDLVIEIGGHTAMNEDTLLGLARADTLRIYLLAKGIEPGRVVSRNYGYSQPIISEEIIESLPTVEEVEAANQKNRRAVVRVLAVKEEE